ncbi:MAG: hypothetical protein ACOYXC_12510 [Candidatus Rifleibacteriota bacterium]
MRKFCLEKNGITLIEAVVGTLIISLVFYMISSFTGNMAFKYKHSFIELENFREAHMAINQLRRDYSMACPYVDSRDGLAELKNFVLKPFAISKIDAKYVGANRKIRVTPNQLAFFKYSVSGFSENPKPEVEEIEYTFDQSSGKLIRKAGSNTTTFDGFKDFSFSAFVYQTNTALPLIWVKMTLDQNKYKDSSFGKPLELTTSLSSTFVADSINYNSWQYRSYHRPK